jgi:hypothetical protein
MPWIAPDIKVYTSDGRSNIEIKSGICARFSGQTTPSSIASNHKTKTEGLESRNYTLNLELLNDSFISITQDCQSLSVKTFSAKPSGLAVKMQGSYDYYQLANWFRMKSNHDWLLGPPEVYCLLWSKRWICAWLANVMNCLLGTRRLEKTSGFLDIEVFPITFKPLPAS